MLILMICGCISQYRPVHSIEYNGMITTFRADLNKASLVPVYPNEEALKNLIFSKHLEVINITFVPNSAENGFYAVGSFELSYKLGLIRQARGLNYSVNATPVNNASELADLDRTVYIFLAGPSQANETSVRVEGNTIYISGASIEQENRKYTDIDLAIDKMLLVLMTSEDD